MNSVQELQLMYHKLLQSAIYGRTLNIATKANDTTRVDEISKTTYDRIVNWLNTTDFYKAPASTQYHESYVGGLCQHSINVANIASDLCELPIFENKVDKNSAVLIALMHDWCKINYYEPYMRNVKNDQTGQWEQKQAFKYKGAQIPLGHGVSSLFIAQKFFRLSLEESLAIRWHMGKWRCIDSEDSELQSANENYPLVHLIQFADQLSIVNY